MNRARDFQSGDRCYIEFRNGPRGRVIDGEAEVKDRDGDVVVLDMDDDATYAIHGDSGLVYVGESITNAQIGRDARLFHRDE